MLAMLSETLLKYDDGHPLTGRLSDVITNEQLRRANARAGFETTPVAIELPPMTRAQIDAASLRLCFDCRLLERLEDAALRAAKPSVAVECGEGVRFISSIWDTVRALARYQRARSIKRWWVSLNNPDDCAYVHPDCEVLFAINANVILTAGQIRFSIELHPHHTTLHDSKLDCRARLKETFQCWMLCTQACKPFG